MIAVKRASAYRGGNDETLGRHATLQLVAPVWDGVAGAPVASLAQSRGSRRPSMLSRACTCCKCASGFPDDIESLAGGAGIEDGILIQDPRNIVIATLC